jgi:DNA-binding response OmpR family regulator
VSQVAKEIRVLHIDDDPGFLSISKELLYGMDSNFKIDFVLNVEEAEQRLSTQDYDVVVADYDLPNENGLDFLQKLRKQGNELPFILFTGKGREEVAKQALSLGVDSYINKSVNIEASYGELSNDIRLLNQKRKAQLCLVGYEKRYAAIFSANENERIKTLFELLIAEIEVMKMMAHDFPYSRSDAELLTGFIADSIDRLRIVEKEIFRLKAFFATKEGIE